jgi:hypothetical protein
MRTLTSRITVTAVVVAVMPSIVGGQRGAVQAPPLVDAEHKIMQADVAPSTTFRVLGDQASPGMYVVRTHFNPGQGSRPHYHDQDRYITVLKGTWWVGAGDVYDPEKMTPIKAGGFMFHRRASTTTTARRTRIRSCRSSGWVRSRPYRPKQRRVERRV